VATDWGGDYGGQPWRDAQLPYAAPVYGAPEGGEPPYTGGRHHRGMRRSLMTSVVAWAALLLGGLGFLGSLAGVIIQVAPRQFTAAQVRQITDWESAKLWRTMPAGKIFPATVSYAPPAALEDDASLALTARRIGIAAQASCRAATDAAAAAILLKNHCRALLRATYTDATNSYVVTVGAAALPSVAGAAAAQRQLVSEETANGGGPTVHAVRFNGTPAAEFSNARRQVSGVLAAGAYVVFYTIGYADSRPRQPVTSDSYGYAEMTSFGTGVAHAVLSVLGVPPSPPSCPGTPGC
jgi:hypothetical protein